MRGILGWRQARQPFSFFEDADNPQPCPDKRLGKDLRNGHLEDYLHPMPYTQVQQMFDEAWGIGRQYYVKAPWRQAISGDAIDILVAHFAQVTSPLSLAVVFQNSGAMCRGPHDQTAFGH